MPKHIVLLILILIATRSVKAHDDSSEVRQFAIVESTHPGFLELLDKALGRFSECLDSSLSSPKNALVVAIWVAKSAYTGEVDTNISFELVPFFSWKDLDYEYVGVFEVNGAYVFLKTETFDPWIRFSGDSISLNQRIIGNFGDVPSFTDTLDNSIVLPNYIYQSTFCKFEYKKMQFVESEQYPCECED
tara:strand:- start:939 stop:1505 length:567 start_codon:yes stop_codon:yes gene_type:complete